MVKSPARLRLARSLATLSIAGIVIAVAATVAGHVDPGPGYDPVRLTLSDFSRAAHGVGIEAAMVALGASSLILLVALLAAAAPIGSAPGVLLLGWAGGLYTAAVVPTDPLTATTMSTSGYIHRYSAAVAFVCLPVAALLLARRLRADRRWAEAARGLRGLALLVGAGLLGLVYLAFPGGRTMLGLAERVTTALEVVLLALLAVRLRRLTAR